MLAMTIAMSGIFLVATVVVARDMLPAPLVTKTTNRANFRAWTTTIALLVLAWVPIVLVVGAVARICR
jgi:hypothetical protein